MTDTRHERQLIIPEIGESGQATLGKSSVLVVGAGGLGSPVLFYLAAAGVGHIGILDFDTVSISNLNRQIIHRTCDIGTPKTASAAEKLRALDPGTRVTIHDERLNSDNIDNIFRQYDAVVDCVDSIEARLLVAGGCVANRLPLAEGGIESFCGFAMSYVPGSACYGCLRTSAAEAGRKIPVLGATAGTAGSIQAAECIKLLLGIGEPLINKMLFFDLLGQQYDTIELAKDPECYVCSGR